MDPCGDGILQGSEECDDNNKIENDGCTNCVVDCGAMSAGEFKSPVTHHCYRLVTASMLAWPDAETDCVSWGGHLASIVTIDEDTFVRTKVPGNVWLGGTDIVNEGTFVWSDGENLSFTHWDIGQPSDTGGEDCMEINGSDFWNDDACAKMQSYLCKRKPAGSK
jgi:cysteine-rich repeat protein